MTFKGKSFLMSLVAALLLGIIFPNISISTADAAWTDHFKFKGDFRYRYEMADKEGSDERVRHRIRARLAVSAKVSDSVSVKLRLATGSDDPVSTNQSLDGYFSTKGFHLDRAYVQWKATDVFTAKLGKMGNPFYKPMKSELVWDGDLCPEGIAAQFETTGDFKVYGNFAYLVIDERKSDTDDAYLFGGQLGFKIPMGSAKLNIGGGYYGYINQEGYDVFGGDFGNSTDDMGMYTMDFTNFEAFAELKAKLGSLPFGIYGHYVVNTEADSNDTGYQFGFSLGKVKKPMSWALKYSYKELEADAVVGAFTDSDFIGGGTDGKGHEIGFGLGLGKHSSLGVSYFLNEIGLEGSSRDYDRLMIDFKFKF